MYNTNSFLRHRIVALLCLAATALGTHPALADSSAPQVPTCAKKIGTVAVAEPATNWWGGLNLDSPAALIKVYVAQSKCFTLVDRGKGLAAAQNERALSAAGDERQGSNVGKGQMKAADYVIVPDIATQNADSGGTKIGGMLAGLVPHGVGAVVGGVSLKSKSADVSLSLTDVRSTEQVALEQGHAKKTDFGFDAGGGTFFGALASGGVSSYANSEIGKVISLAYLDAYSKMVVDVKANTPDAKASNVQQAITMTKDGKLYESSNLKSAVVRELPQGSNIYPTGDKMGVWWKVTDELGNEGWVLSSNTTLAR